MTITRGDVEQGVLSHVQMWLPYEIASLEREKGIAPKSIQLPKAWNVITRFSRFPADRLPWIFVISSGIHAGKPPYRDGDGDVTAHWLIAVGAIVVAKDADSAKELAGYYGAAIRDVMMQKPSIGGIANATDWDDEAYNDLGRMEEANLAGVRLVFTIEVRGVFNVFDGYRGSTPPEDPYAIPAGPPIMDSVIIEVDKKI